MRGWGGGGPNKGHMLISCHRWLRMGGELHVYPPGHKNKDLVCVTKGLVTDYNELREGGGGGYKTGVKFDPYEKGGRGGGRTSFSHAEGEAQKVLG